MIDPDQFLKYIIRPALSRLELGGPAAEALVLGICLTESNLTYIDQVERGGDNKPGPAYGPGQMEAATHDDIWENFLKWQLTLASLVRSWCIGRPYVEQMHGNWFYAVAMIRVHLRRQVFPMPDAEDYKTMAEIWKKYYNTAIGAGIEQKAESSFALAVAIVQRNPMKGQ